MILDYIRLRFFTNKDKIEKFTFKGYKTIAYVDSVYDGDTITIIFIHNGNRYKMSCRLYGIDSPEIRNKDLREKKKAIDSRDFLRDLILHKYKRIEFLDFDKYGRPLIKIYNKKTKTCINELMVINYKAKEYFGGKK